ncbi:MAG: hypothetical protein IKG03_01865 [Clostridiales bacterium]|nr:hypothetical protein [Clostridiales bacterium]
MSKVKSYIDTKQKALHRQRRYETAHKKKTRIRNAKQGVYYYWGYYHEDERRTCRYEEVEIPEEIYTYEKIDWDWYKQTGEKVYVAEKTVCPAHTGKRETDVKIIPVSIVKRINKNAKDLKKEAARRIRRQKINEDSAAINGSLYKKDYEMQWALI